LQKPTTGPSDASPRSQTGDAGPLDGNAPTPAPRTVPPVDARRAVAGIARTLHLAPRPDTAVRRPGAGPSRAGARPMARMRLRGPVPGQLALFDPRPAGYRAAAAGVSRAVLRQDRSMAVLVAIIVLFAAVAAAVPAVGVAAASGSTDGIGTASRLTVGPAIGDGSGPDGAGAVEGADSIDAGVVVAGAADGTGAAPVDGTVPAGTDQGVFLPDGTLLKPIAVDTTVPDTSGTVETYRVRPGDTLTGIAAKFGISIKTIWWANNLKSKDRLKPGLKLRIPTDDGLLVKVEEGDSLDRIARAYGVDPTLIQKANDLPDGTVYIGQTVFVPQSGARIPSVPVPTPKPTPKPVQVTVPANPGAGGNSVGGGDSQPVGPVRYGGGGMAWPVVGGGNYISQYSHYGHPAIDIAGDYGAPVVAAAGGRVVYAGWRSNGGGYQVWIDHGNGLYSTYNHLSAVSVGSGQSVGAGQRVGSLGQSGAATGPHLHFEVWVGYPWGGGYRVNPLAYLR
jgi:murein DD-endopeptidase MepM/ murein hydrolase activator NlpD